MNLEAGPTTRRVLRSLRRVNLQGNVFGQSVAIRLGLSESDVETLEVLLDAGASTAGRLAELMGLSTGAMTRVVDRLEQAGYVRRTPDPADRRRVVVEVIPDRVRRVQGLLGRMDEASAAEIAHYSDDQLDLIGDFLDRMAGVARREASSLREDPGAAVDTGGPAEHSAPIGAISSARLSFRSGVERLGLRGGEPGAALYRARFEGGVPKVRLRGSTVTVQYHGGLLPWDWRKRRAELELNPGARWDIDITGGVQRLNADLAGLDLASLSLTGGTDRVALSFGRPTGEVKVRLVGGTNELRVDRPAGVAAQLRLLGGAGGVEFDGTRHGGSGMTRLESAGAGRAKDRFVVEVVGGSSRVVVAERA
jgi:DNA-binding MarR family transcriptional regulator